MAAMHGHGPRRGHGRSHKRAAAALAARGGGPRYSIRFSVSSLRSRWCHSAAATCAPITQ
jgi:sirohydrochlorin ferrochelatase